mmetsp:Transcript_26258/g.26174  ORF Transcript_26258/g.26174 Transcript_26258/m.26174 type:complete len:221 (-) Transcript_26258:26-688(-)
MLKLIKMISPALKEVKEQLNKHEMDIFLKALRERVDVCHSKSDDSPLNFASVRNKKYNFQENNVAGSAKFLKPPYQSSENPRNSTSMDRRSKVSAFSKAAEGHLNKASVTSLLPRLKKANTKQAKSRKKLKKKPRKIPKKSQKSVSPSGGDRGAIKEDGKNAEEVKEKSVPPCLISKKLGTKASSTRFEGLRIRQPSNKIPGQKLRDQITPYFKKEESDS